MCHEQSALHVVIKRNVFLHLLSPRAAAAAAAAVRVGRASPAEVTEAGATSSL